MDTNKHFNQKMFMSMSATAGVSLALYCTDEQTKSSVAYIFMCDSTV